MQKTLIAWFSHTKDGWRNASYNTAKPVLLLHLGMRYRCIIKYII